MQQKILHENDREGYKEIQLIRRMTEPTIEILQNHSLRIVADLFINHNVSCRIDENKIVFDKEQISIETYCTDVTDNPKLTVLRLDVCINYGIRPLVESFAGFGKDLKTANTDALKNFAANSFHPILSAFFTSGFDTEIQKYNWTIDNKNFEVFSGYIGMRGTEPENSTANWVGQLEDEIKKLRLSEGIHWIRLFYSQINNQTTLYEVLLDNENCVPLMQAAQNFDWHKQEEFYSVRVFMILRNGIDFGRMVKIIGSGLEYEEVFSMLNNMGLPGSEIEKAYAFIPEVFGRQINKEMGVAGTYSNKAIITNDKKEQFEINLNNEEIYRKTFQFASALTKNDWTPELKRISMMSAAFIALNNVLLKGARLEEIDSSTYTTSFFIPSYSQPVTVKQEKKPFWKFW